MIIANHAFQSFIYRYIVFFKTVQLFYLSFRNNLHRELHGKLKSDLITGFLQKKANVLKWKEQFKLYCRDDVVRNGEIDGHFDFLESEGKIKIGDYEFLKSMFRYVDVTSEEVITKASTEINAALQNNKNKSQ